MTDKYEAILTCGYCKKKTPISDGMVGRIFSNNKEIHSLCSCGHTSYASSIRVKVTLNKQDWRMGYGSAK